MSNNANCAKCLLWCCVPRHKQTALTLLRRDVDLQPQQPRVQVDEVVAKASEASARRHTYTSQGRLTAGHAPIWVGAAAAVGAEGTRQSHSAAAPVRWGGNILSGSPYPSRSCPSCTSTGGRDPSLSQRVCVAWCVCVCARRGRGHLK